MVGKIVDDPVDGFFDPNPAGVIERAAIDVELSQRQPPDRDLVVIGRQGFVLEERFGSMRGLAWVVREHVLIETFFRRQRRLVAEQHLEKLQVLDMPPQHDQAHGQRRRQQQSDRPPQQRPERGGDQHRDAGKPRAVTIEPGLDHKAGDELDGKEETGDPEHRRPARIDGNGERGWKRSGDNRADVGDETQQHRQDAPECRVRHADEPQPGPDQHADARVDRTLHQKIAAQVLGGVVHRRGGAPKIARPGQSDETVSQVLTLQQEEDHKDDDDAGRRHRLQQWSGDLQDELDRGGAG